MLPSVRALGAVRLSLLHNQQHFDVSASLKRLQSALNAVGADECLNLTSGRVLMCSASMQQIHEDDQKDDKEDDCFSKPQSNDSDIVSENLRPETLTPGAENLA